MKNKLKSSLPVFKVMGMGYTGSGQSSILSRYLYRQFIGQAPTIGFEFINRKVSYAGERFQLQLWDTAGQQRYRCMVCNYFKGSNAVILVFDLTNEHSLDQAAIWMELFVERCGNDTPKILLGNKSDLLTSQALQLVLSNFKEKIDRLIVLYRCLFFTVSARSGEGIDEAFSTLTEQIYKTYIKSRRESPKDVIKLNAFEIQKSGRIGRHPKNRC